MKESNRLIIFAIGVVIIFVVIIVIRTATNNYTSLLGYLREEIILYISIVAVLIFAQFLIGTTYGKKRGKKNSGITDQSEINNIKRRYSDKLIDIKRKVEHLEEKNTSTTLKLKEEISEREALEKLLERIVSYSNSKLSKDIIHDHPELYKKEQFFLDVVRVLSTLRDLGKDDFNIEASLAFTGSIKIYEMLHALGKEIEGYSEEKLDELLNIYISELKGVLNHIHTVQYGIKNTYKPESHQAIGMIQEYDQVKVQSFKIVSNSSGAIIFKALVEKS